MTWLIASTSNPRSVKTRLQVQVRGTGEQDSNSGDVIYKSTWDAISRIVAEEGSSGLYAGISGSLIGVASTNFAYFYWYTIVRALYSQYSRGNQTPSTAVELCLGAAAGAVAQIFTIPVAVVTTRQQTASKADRKGLLATAREVIEGPDGVTGLWRGLKASLVLVVNPAITYGAYERLKTALFPSKTTLRPWEAFGELPCHPQSAAYEADHMNQPLAQCPKLLQPLPHSRSLSPKSAYSPSHRHPEMACHFRASLRY